jgi:peptidoglycan lytic transglycosylase G
MAERQDWIADTEGNLTAPGEAAPSTDEFGRDDPESLERARRRQEREQRRRARGGKASEQSATPPEPENQRAAEPSRQPAKTKQRRAEAKRKPAQPAPPPPPVDGDDPAPGGQRGRFRRRRILALGLLLVGALVVWFLVAFFQPPPFDPGNGTGEVVVTVPSGATASDVADLLSKDGVVSNGTLFEWRLKLAGKSGSILPGRYVLAHDMSYGTAIDRLTSSGGKVTVTIPEGETRDQIAPQVRDLGLTGDYLAATKSFNGFDPNRYGAHNPKSLEGFLFPATYQVDPGASVDQFVSEQLRGFQENLAGVNMSYAKSKNLTVYDVLTIASMIEKEVMVPAERPLVAAVIYNRLHRGMPLGIDATTRYEFHNYTGAITQSELSSPSPYNTRIHAGLPPTPIGNPGLASIQAAAHPAKVNYLYYVLKAGGNGQHCFTASAAEFNQLAAAYQAGHAPPSCRN